VTIGELRVRAVDVPLRRPLRTSARVIPTAPLLLLDLHLHEGVVGRAYVFCYDALGQRLMAEVLADAAPLVAGLPLDPAAAGDRLARRHRLLGAPGVIAMALAGVDIAVWDALAQAAGVPLARHLGAELVALPAYNSNGLGLIGAAFDLQRIGGVSGWLAAAALAAPAAMPVSSHLFPEVSAHLMAATPTRDRLEVVDWANPILAAPLELRDGTVSALDEPGTGVRWDERAVARYRL
jgi:L-alanine-DL-glutamate epimerase-like enolase superfamily enzyme